MRASSLNEALILLGDAEDKSKQTGLELLKEILDRDIEKLAALGHDLVVYKRLANIVTFESKITLNLALDILQAHYFKNAQLSDELAELLMLRAVRSIDYDTSRSCLEKFCLLIDYLGDDVAKHSKQIIKMVDINTMPSLNDLLIEILNKLKNILPQRRVVEDL